MSFLVFHSIIRFCMVSWSCRGFCLLEFYVFLSFLEVAGNRRLSQFPSALLRQVLLTSGFESMDFLQVTPVEQVLSGHYFVRKPNTHKVYA